MFKVHYTTRGGQETSQSVETREEARELAEQVNAWAVEDTGYWSCRDAGVEARRAEQMDRFAF